jgi:transcriptional regulator
MYVPSHFKQEELSAIHELISRAGFASLVTATANGMIATQAPVLCAISEGNYGTLRGHIARANSQWKTAKPGREALAIFLGPNDYISPQWYEAKREHGRVVPTWNYVAVHAYGEIKFSNDRDLLLDIVTRLTNKHEERSENAWKVTDAPAEYIEGMLKAIVAFEMPISRIEASWKLSQNRSEADRAGVVAGLKERGSTVAEEMLKHDSAGSK